MRLEVAGLLVGEVCMALSSPQLRADLGVGLPFQHDVKEHIKCSHLASCSGDELSEVEID